MSTLAEIERAVPQLTSAELAQLEQFVREFRSKQGGAGLLPSKPWMALAGCLAGEADELHRIDSVVEAEFETVDPADWR